ncbi:hypothetical protein V8C44DRAFT_345979 [Trichoderma aethiopicum]
MSQKINAKNLSYNSSLPPFLAALRAQASGATGPDPILAAQRRGAKKRSGSEEAEDAPLVVDEHGNALQDLKVNKDGTVEEAAAAENAEDGAEGESKDEKSDAAKKSEAEPARASIGGRKRKVGKVVGEEAQDGGAEGAPTEKKDGTAKKEADDAEETSNRKPKKKAKKIKLSFDEDEG